MSKSPAPSKLDLTDRAPKLASRRNVLFGLGAVGLVAGCSRSMEFDMPAMGLDTTTTGSIRPQISVDKQVTRPELMYASFTDEGYQLPEIPFAKVDPKFRRQIVVDPTGEAPGTIVVRLQERYLYLVQPGGDAIRYGVGIGRDGFLWNGRANIQYGKKWPTWTPPRVMIARKPELVKWAGGQPGGLDNPLGARALYIYKDGQDTGYRVHGSPEWWTIGQAMSSGCVRMINQDVIDLYSRVNGKTPIVVS
ncbi:L,D-transpeptidase [Aminobacter sp. AP02]|uniref:L,D-transpeptidase n=1 Tax=Aminobacter sp. AP02 TaxID=2135737 RepID=UPI001FDFBCC1|nr:L,D-transpeptidase [Aminobacter sp. AP02]